MTAIQRGVRPHRLTPNRPIRTSLPGVDTR
jgi:hypothetical protein